jgi:hypothetical protein
MAVALGRREGRVGEEHLHFPRRGQGSFSQLVSALCLSRCG